MDKLNITVNEYQDKVILEIDKAISPLKTIRDLTKVMAENGMPYCSMTPIHFIAHWIQQSDKSKT